MLLFGWQKIRDDIGLGIYDTYCPLLSTNCIPDLAFRCLVSLAGIGYCIVIDNQVYSTVEGSYHSHATEVGTG